METMVGVPDALHGQCLIPSAIWPMLHTDMLIRLRRISMSVVPNALIPWGAVANRAQHSIGVCHTVGIVEKLNPNLTEEQRLLLLLSSLLHDAGSPPLSHLTEPIMEKLT